jgi:hypothetical protein
MENVTTKIKSPTPLQRLVVFVVLAVPWILFDQSIGFLFPSWQRSLTHSISEGCIWAALMVLFMPVFVGWTTRLRSK